MKLSPRTVGLVGIALLMACAGLRPVPSDLSGDPVALVAALNGDDGASVYAHHAGSSMIAACSEAKTKVLLDSVRHSYGSFVRAKLLESSRSGAVTSTKVEANFEHGAALFKLDISDDGKIVGMRVNPLEASASKDSSGPADGYRSQITYGLPVLGEWVVGNGGPTVEVNVHVGNQQQWYAYDLLRADEKGDHCPGAAKTNQGCLAFGQDVIAPAAGTVVMVVDGVPDNDKPGEMNKYIVPGNMVELDHGNGEYTFLAHLESGTIVVHPGQHVAKGEHLAKTGNSGNTSEPHLHWHLANDRNMSKGHGLPIRFEPLHVNGQTVAEPHPTRNDRLAAGSAPGA